MHSTATTGVQNPHDMTVKLKKYSTPMLEKEKNCGASHVRISLFPLKSSC